MDYLEVINLPLMVFTLVGFNPLVEKRKILYRTYGVFVHLIFCDLFLLLQTVYLSKVDNILVITELLSIYLTYIGLCIKSVLSVHFLNDMKLLEDAKLIILKCKREFPDFGLKFSSKMKQVKLVFYLFYFSCFLTIFMASFLFLYFKSEKPYSIPYAMWSPFDYENSFTGFIIMWLFQLLSPVSMCGIVVSADILPIFFFSLSTGLLEELADRVNAIDTTFQTKLTTLNAKIKFDDMMHNHETKVLEELENCIEIHLKIRQLIVASQRIFSIMICVQFAISSIILCTTAYSISKVMIFFKCACYKSLLW